MTVTYNIAHLTTDHLLEVMTYKGAFQSTILGRAIRFASKGKLLRYQDEIELPGEYKRHGLYPASEKDEVGRAGRGRSKEGKGSDREAREADRLRTTTTDIPTTPNDGHARSLSDETVVEGRGRDEEDIFGTGEGDGRTGDEGQGKGKHPHLVDWYGPDDPENP